MECKYPDNVIQMLVSDLELKEIRDIDYDTIETVINNNLDAMVKKFSPRETYIFNEYYRNGKPLAELSVELNISRQRIYVIFRKINNKLKLNVNQLLFGSEIINIRTVQEKYDEMVAECVNRLNALEKAMSEGRFDDAKLIIGAEKDNIYYQPLEKLGLKTRPYNCLKQLGVMTVRELCMMSRNQLFGIHNLGVGSVHNIEDRLFEFGLRIRMR